MDFLDKVKRQQEQESSLKWEGTFRDYLALLKEKPWVAQSAHSRLYNMICSEGVTEENGKKYFKFFEKDIFGSQETIQRLVEEYFHPAAKGLDVKKRILLLMGPVSGGKSTLVTKLKRGLEQFTRTDAGAVYAIKGCPMHEDPLHLIPEHLRQDFYNEYGIVIEGKLSPLNTLRLKEEYDGDIEKVRVERVFFSEKDRIGIGTFSPSDPKSQDISELTGSIDFSTISTYGSESDPRAYRFDGELNIANRGLMEFQEMLKSDEKFLWHLLSLTQEGNFKIGRYSLISADEMIIAHTNESEFRAFIENDKNEALRSRMLVVPVPYTLSAREEERIYEKMLRESRLSGIDLAPHSLEIAAIFSVITRLKPSKIRQIDLLNKLKLYNGEKVDGFTHEDVIELKNEHRDEGMSGVDPRFIMNRISLAVTKNESGPVSALDILRSIKEGLLDHPSIKLEEKEHYKNLIMIVREEYDEIVKNEVQMAAIESFEESAQSLLNLYLDNVEAYCQNGGDVDPLTSTAKEPDEKLMRSIEEHLGISGNAKKDFREEILIRVSAFARKGKVFDYKSHDGLYHAIQKKLFADFKDLIKVTTAMSPTNLETKERLKEVEGRLVQRYGYSKRSAEQLLHYVSGLLQH
ncbi:serine protein kinase [Pullulanibacillus pueri]|uniref:Protein PrkA n=1 Tax=Pullulanibacillus pueri TaxID=1437324 RepID=A0A8J2ZXW3_9BACL|nr:protein prkA [Pullulanibacillus pueri]MBM7683579.1 serine protein kinase [Pullulanibacillus pueri]GGH84494.1 protein PrkA [Pullulanibacillus pueri]